MTLVAEADQRRIADAITEAERTTSGEIVAVIAPESCQLPARARSCGRRSWRWPCRGRSCSGPGGRSSTSTCCSSPSSPRSSSSSCRGRVRLALVPRSVKHARAHRRAVEQFLAQNLHTTVGRTGVLIFVSVGERFAEILADAAIHEKVPEGAWQAIVADLTEHIGKGQPGDGFVRAIAAVGEHLARHFPPDAGRPHALSNHLIVLPPA